MKEVFGGVIVGCLINFAVGTIYSYPSVAFEVTTGVIALVLSVMYVGLGLFAIAEGMKGK